MNAISQISVRIKLLFLLLIIVLFSIISILAFLHTENTILTYRGIEKRFEAAFSGIQKIDSKVMALSYLMQSDSGDQSLQVEPGELEHSFSMLLGDLEACRIAALQTDDSLVMQKTAELIALTALFRDQAIATFDTTISNTTIPPYTNLHDYIDHLDQKKNEVMERISTLGSEIAHKLKLNLLIILIVSILFIIGSISFFAVTASRNIDRILGFVRSLAQGAYPDHLRINSGDEFQELGEKLNSFLDQQNEKLRFLKTIGKGDETTSYKPLKSDVLGNELSVMAARLKDLKEEEEERLADENKRRWISEGVTEFAEILRSERENVSELAFLVIRKIVSYLKIEMGTLFLAVMEEGKEEYLETIAAYAYDRRKYLDRKFMFGEGLPGTCALEKERIYIDDIPESYSDVISGVGSAKPKYVLLLPLKIEDEIFGVIELASFREVEVHEFDYLDQIAESIATTLAAVKTNERTSRLLKQSQEQAELLLKQEEEMKINLKDLERAQEESGKKESEITGIINAMNQSSLVAEFGVNGRFININDRFLDLLESPREQMLGKHHNEFAIVDKYSDEYKARWESLKEGETITTQEPFKLFNGKEVWLQQTFTPIFNNQGKVYKILNIALDVTQSKVLQENLKKQAAEITRKNLEMFSLNEAVNSSIIKCELDIEGIIIDLNDNFCTISGYNRKELLGRNYRLFLKEMEKEQFERIWSEIIKDKTYEGAIRRTKPTGEEIWLMATFSPVKNESGEIYKIYFLALDITEKRLKYQLLEEANREIERLKSLLGKYEN